MVEQKGFYDCADFPFVELLEQGAPAIRRELDQVMGARAFGPWPERHLYGEGWEVFGLYLFERPIPLNCSMCPETAAVVRQVDGVTTAGFSRLAPGTHIKPHVGFNDGVLRCHLGLITPPDCGLRVGDEVRHWEAGKCLVFDDTLEHEAWNESETARVVLLLDFRKRPNGSVGNGSRRVG